MKGSHIHDTTDVDVNPYTAARPRRVSNSPEINRKTPMDSEYQEIVHSSGGCIHQQVPGTKCQVPGSTVLVVSLDASKLYSTTYYISQRGNEMLMTSCKIKHRACASSLDIQYIIYRRGMGDGDSALRLRVYIRREAKGGEGIEPRVVRNEQSIVVCK